MTTSPALCNLDGAIMPETEARIPVLDRGFLFGDSVYEVMRTRDRVPFAWRRHLARLRGSAEGIGLRLDLDDAAIMTRVKRTLEEAEFEEAYVRVIATRGTGSAPSIDLAYATGRPTWVILVRDVAPMLKQGPVRLALTPRLRNDRRALDPSIKSGNYLNNLLGLAEAKAAGATDCLFLNGAGHATEASTSNFYMVRDGRIATPPVEAGILRGITRELLFELCAELDVGIDVRDFGVDELRDADEMFLSSTLTEVAPVESLDGVKIGDGRPGPVTTRLREHVEAHCARWTREHDRPGYVEL